MATASTAWFSFHLGCQRSAVALSALNGSPLTQLPSYGDQTLASVPSPTKGRSSLTNTPVCSPSSLSYLVLHGSIYSFLLVRYSCLFSDGFLRALLGLKVYPWYILEERCIPYLPTPPPSCSPWYIFNRKIFFSVLILLTFWIVYFFSWLLKINQSIHI